MRILIILIFLTLNLSSQYSIGVKFDRPIFDSNSFIYNKFNNPFIKNENYTNFLKKHFIKLYKETIIEINILKDLGNGEYVVDEIKNGVYSYKGNIIYVDYTKKGKTHIKTYGVKLSTKKIKVNAYYSLSVEKQMKLKAIYMMMWHFSIEHENIILSIDSKIEAYTSLINKSIWVSKSNFIKRE